MLFIDVASIDDIGTGRLAVAINAIAQLGILTVVVENPTYAPCASHPARTALCLKFRDNWINVTVAGM